MNRNEVLAQLGAHQPFDQHERKFLAATTAFVAHHTDFHDRRLAAGHVTGSAWIVDTDRRRALLVHHKKLDRWLQPGGHVDGDASLLAAALREAREETGMDCRAPTEAIFDIDVHQIPAHGGEPAHPHYDVRFLFEARPEQQLRSSAESHALRWITLGEIAAMGCGPSIDRMVRKVWHRPPGSGG